MAQTFIYYTDASGQIWQVGVDTTGAFVKTAVSSIPGSPSLAQSATPAKSVQSLIGEMDTRLAGLANAFTNQQKLSFLNEGKDEFWSALVTLSDDYFMQATSTTALQSNTFAALATSTREYALPGDCLAPRFIECTTAGYENTRFVYRKITHPDFQNQRRTATSVGSSSGSQFNTYYYTIVGKGTLVLAAYPEVAFTLKIWYVRALPDFTLSDSINETVMPFSRKIVDYAIMKVQLVKDPTAFIAWKDEWRSGIILMLEAASPKDSTGPVFVMDYDD
jgi:hypothetical protein